MGAQNRRRRQKARRDEMAESMEKLEECRTGSPARTASPFSHCGRPVDSNGALLKEWSCDMMSIGSATSPIRRHHTENFGM
jgi:hypothetical protein